MLVLHEPVQGIQIPWLDGVISQSFGVHAGTYGPGTTTSEWECVFMRTANAGHQVSP